MLALEQGLPITITVEQTECIVIRKDCFDRIGHYVYDDGPMTVHEKRWLLSQAGKRAGWDDPEMDVYNDLDPRQS